MAKQIACVQNHKMLCVIHEIRKTFGSNKKLIFTRNLNDICISELDILAGKRKSC